MAIGRVGMDVAVKFCGSRSTSSRDIRATHFVMDDDAAFCLTRSPSSGGARQNATKLNFAISAKIRLNAMCHYW